MTASYEHARRLAAACIILGGFATSALGAASESGTKVDVVLWDKGAAAEMSMDRGIGMPNAGSMNMGVTASTTTVPAGEVTFNVTNSSKEVVHEMLVVPLPDESKGLPYVAKDAKFDEDAAGSLGEVEELDPGKSGSLTLTLKPGKYALSCNIANHYMNGMWTILTVQ